MLQLELWEELLIQKWKNSTGLIYFKVHFKETFV